MYYIESKNSAAYRVRRVNMKDYAKSFYKGKAWRQVSGLYMASKNYICERCGGIGTICHHKTYITPENIGNPDITLNQDNLECLCQECHNLEHMLKKPLALFNDQGDIERVKDSKEIAEYKQMLKELEKAGL